MVKGVRNFNPTRDTQRKPRKAPKKPKTIPLQLTPSLLGRTSSPEPSSVTALDETAIAIPAHFLKIGYETIVKDMKVLPETAVRGTVDTGQTALDKDFRETTAGTIAPRMKAMPTRNRPKTSLRAAARETLFRETSKTRRSKSPTSKNRNYPGYVQPNRINTRPISARISTEKADAFNLKIHSENVTMQELFSALVDEVIARGIPAELKRSLLKQDMVRMREKYGRLLPSPGNS